MRPGLRSASDISRLTVPATNSRAQHSTADWMFSVSPRLWNSLPGAVRSSKSIDSF